MKKMLLLPFMWTIGLLAMDGSLQDTKNVTKKAGASKRQLSADKELQQKKIRTDVWDAIFAISCDPNPGLLCNLQLPEIGKDTATYLLEISGEQFPIPKNVAELSVTLRGFISDIGETTVIPLMMSYPESIRPFLACLKAIAEIKNQENYESALSLALKPYVEKTNIIHLLLTANYLHVPVLFDYLVSVIGTHLAQEKDVIKLGSFVKACSTMLPADLQRAIIKKLLQVKRIACMHLFKRESLFTLCELPLRAALCSTQGTSSLTFGWYDSEGQTFTTKAFGLKELTQADRNMRNIPLELLSSISMPLKDYYHGLINNSGTELVFNKKSDMPAIVRWGASYRWHPFIEMKQQKPSDILPVDNGILYQGARCELSTYSRRRWNKIY